MSLKSHGSEDGLLHEATLLPAVNEAVLKRRKLKVTEHGLSQLKTNNSNPRKTVEERQLMVI